MSKKNAVIGTAFLLLLAWIAGHVSLVFTSLNEDVVYWQMPFTAHVFELPLWAWRASFFAVALCLLMIVVLWTSVLVGRFRSKRISN